MTKNTNEIINFAECKYNYFDSGNTQRSKCSIDNYYCDCLRSPDCYFKQLQRLKQENEKLQNIKDETYFKLKEEYQLYLKETEDILEKLNKYNKKDMLEMMSSLRQDWHRLFNKKEVIEEKMYKYEECLDEVRATILKLKEAIQENNIADYGLYIDYALQKINEVLDANI